MSERDDDLLAGTQHRAERAAHESIRGYVHQATLTAREWLRAEAHDVLICEGNEDIDRLIYEADGTFHEISETQIKAIAGRVTARTPAVHESIFNFMRSFREHDSAGRRCRFTFSTTAARTKQRLSKNPKTELESTDVLERWTLRSRGASADSALIAAIRSLAGRYLPKPKSQASEPEDLEPGEVAIEEAEPLAASMAAAVHSAAVHKALAYLDAEATRWERFLASVQWSFEQPDLNELQHQLVSLLASDARTKDLPPELLSQRLVAQVLSASAKEDVEERTLTKESLDGLVRQSASELQAWAEKTHAPAFFSKLLEHEVRIARIENELSAEGKHAQALSRTLERLNDTASQQSRFDSIWKRYFKSRVVAGLFVRPFEFDTTVRAFGADNDAVGTARKSFDDEIASAAMLSTPTPKLDSARGALKVHAEARPLQQDHTALGEWEESFVQRLREVERETRPAERGLRGNESAEFERYTLALENRDWISRVQVAFVVLRRLRTPIWISVAQAGRGKSNFA